MDTINTINLIFVIIFILCYAYQFVYIPIALIRKDKPLPDAAPHRFAVLVCARNEEVVIGNLIDSIKAQDYPSDYIDIYLVADNCTDNTAKVARSHGATVFERFNTELVGKGYALEFLLSKIKKKPDAYIVFDADNIVDSNFMKEINKSYSAGAEVITGYRNSKNYGDNWLSSGYALWFLRDSQYLNRPRHFNKTSCTINGTGFLFSQKILEKCGGWHFFSLIEDIEFTSYLAVNGEKIDYCQKAIFYDEQPTNFIQSIRQRIRWVHGYLQVIWKYGGKLIKGIFHGSFSCLDILLSIAPATILSFLSIFISLIFIIIYLCNGGNLVEILLPLANTFIIMCLAVFIIGLFTVITEWKAIKASTGRKIFSVFTFPLFMLTYVIALFAALFVKPGWKQIKHDRDIKLKDIEK